jgi:hypothetical protein
VTAPDAMPAAQQGFADALLEPSRPVPAGLVTWNGSDPARRFAVYRNNVVVSLRSALADTFPVVRALAGDDLFAELARGYIRAEPPRSPVLTQYGDGFADWLARCELVAHLPWLSDLARLERARVRAFHAADAPSLAADDIATRLAEPARLPTARLVLQPSLQVVDSAFAIVSLWAAHQGAAQPHDVVATQPEAALVLRIDDEVAVLRIPAAAAAFCRRLQQGLPLGEAAADDTLDLGAALALLIRHGALCAWQAGDST